MGGINCDMSDPVVITAPGKRVVHKDSVEYTVSVALLSRSIFTSYQAFLALQCAIEDVVLVEFSFPEQTTSLTEAVSAKANGYRSELEQLFAAISGFRGSASKNFSSPELIEFMKSAYAAGAESGLLTISQDGGILNGQSEISAQTAAILSDGMELGLADEFAALTEKLKSYADKLNVAIKDASRFASESRYQLSIRELENAVSPLSIASQSTWLRLMATHSSWAVLNMATLPSLEGKDTPIESLIDKLE
ncbi:hypothetical protein [uncultured Roseobacter sp.]|uniref:hypothetical protein n=1 Tax=uncultured Roseobacter sp. TaxID=114847 RepID=UPI00262DEA77|nr:hypothetical protein [uncultured Roseobacter sp.]